MFEERRRPGRPRNQDLDAAIDAAVIDLLTEHGYEGLRVDDVAARAGVSKPTIYRRFPNKPSLAVHALARLKQHTIPANDTGDVLQDLRRIVHDLFASLDGTALGGAFAGLVAEKRHHPDLAEVMEGLWATRRDIVRTLAERGVAEGVLRDDVPVDAMLELMVAPAYYRLLITGQAIGPAEADAHADALLAALTSPSHIPSSSS